jgi:hypothetical protein
MYHYSIVKSGYDFDDFSQVTLELERKDGRPRRYVVKSAKGVLLPSAHDLFSQTF